MTLASKAILESETSSKEHKSPAAKWVVDSLKVIAHKKICENINKCSNLEIDQQFASSVKEGIINSARLLKIEEAKKEKK